MSDGQTSTNDIVSQLTPEQQTAVVQYAQANGLSGEALREYIETNFNQQSVNNEALLVQGGYDAGVATAVAGSIGVGGSAEATQQAAADFARMAAQAVANGQPLDQMRFNDPALTREAQEAIYEQVAQQQGTSAERVEQEAKERAERDMAAIQGGVMGMGGAHASLSLLGELVPSNVPDVRAALGIGRSDDGWSRGSFA